MILKLARRAIDLSRPAVMGILNVTPDSFSDGGRWGTVEAACCQARRMVEEGARLIDVGGESTRPGAAPVSEQEELDRVLPVIERMASELDPLALVISIDSMKPAVMRAALHAGAELVNDVHALRAHGALEAVAESGAAVCLMHMQGEPQTMQQAPEYADVIAEVRRFLAARIAACEAAGIERSQILVDPGIGFGKTQQHNLTLLGGIAELESLGCPILIGASRKSLFGSLLGLSVADRLIPSLTAAALAIGQGAAIIRAHDVRATVLAVNTAAAIRQARKHQDE